MISVTSAICVRLACHTGDRVGDSGPVEDSSCADKSSSAGICRRSFWRQFRRDDTALNTEQPHSSGSGSGSGSGSDASGGRKVWVKVTRVFGRHSERRHGAGSDQDKETTTWNKQPDDDKDKNSNPKNQTTWWCVRLPEGQSDNHVE